MPRFMVTCHLFVEASELEDARDAARAALTLGGDDLTAYKMPSFIVGKAYEGFEDEDAPLDYGFRTDDDEGDR